MKRIMTLALLGLAMPLAALAKGNVTGTVFNNGDGTPIDFAVVQLIDAKTSQPTTYGAQTDEDGNFTIHDVKDGKYIVRITNLGSVPQERTVTIAGGNASVGKVGLSDDEKMLKEVVVTGVKGQMHFELDRKVFNVDSNIASAGSSASELLESIPSVEVDQDGEVSLRGNSSVTVWINGKESGMTSDNRAQILEQIPAETIDRIEVITNPSAKYNPEGTAGIINIILKNDLRTGYFGSAEVGANSRGGANVNGNINYNVGRFETFAGLGLRMRHNKGGSESRRLFDNGDYLNSDATSRNHGDNIFLRLGATWHVTDRDDIYASGFAMFGHRWGHSQTQYASTVPDQWRSNLNLSRENSDSQGAHIEWGYKHSWNSSHTLDANVSFNRWGGPMWTGYNQEQTFEDGSVESVYQEEVQSVNTNIWEAKIDYTNQLTNWLKLEAGYNGNYSHENTPVSILTGTEQADATLDPRLYNRFIYNNNVSALYFTLGGKYRSFSFSAGLRSESWQVRTRSLGYGQTKSDVPEYKKNFFALFPSAFISWSLPHDNELQLNYTRRLRRPWGPQLNSFRNIEDPTNIHMGNPELEPEYTNSFELNYIKSWTQHMVSLSAYVRTSDNMISHISFMGESSINPGEQTMYLSHANVGKQVNSGCEIVVKNNLFNRVLDLTTTANLYNNHISAWSIVYPMDGVDYNVSGARQNSFAWDIRCMASVRIPWGLAFQATGRYNSRTFTAQGTREPGWDVEAGIRKTAGNWSFSLNCRDIFNSRRMHHFTYGDGYTQESKRWRSGRTLKLTIKYSFGNMKSRKNAQINDQEPIDASGYGGD